MDTERFWQIVDASRRKGGGNPDKQLEVLRQSLQSLSAEEVAAFGEHFDECDVRAYRWDLWAAAYIMHGGCSDDAFMDFRGSLICRGRDVFENAVANPDSLAELTFADPERDLFFEGFQYLPRQVYEEKTGRDFPPRTRPFPSEPAGDPWEEESGDLKKICPKLWEKYGWEES